MPWLVFAALSGSVFVLLWFLLQLQQNMLSAKRTSQLGLRLRDDFGSSPTAFDRFFNKLVFQSGLPISPSVGMLATLCIATLAGAICFVVTDDVRLTVLSILVAVGLCGLVVVLVRARRRALVQNQLPEVVDRIARSIRSGESLESSMLSATQQQQGPLSQDFARCATQVRMGLPISEALQQLEKRNELFDVRLFIGTLVMHRTAGGDLAQMLERLAFVLHERLVYRRQVSTASATARLAALIIGAAAPGLLIYYAFQKEYIGDVWKDPSSQFFLIVAIGLEMVGIIWLVALTRNEP